ncbi:hypothetical protein UFOVP189_29 [uncultured Caudovirales phage]|uniref:Uncharacterized protein n=1 Tax=uncultured Caudovirales phage TaxID=2100421 RepID=A0A6J7WMK4_9CAUD|nr:hypothetical protein UFOVP189_29 [uncultured Caudovirales phage]
MKPLEMEIKKTVFAHLPAVGDFGIIDRADLATILHSACTEVALAGWARGTEATQKRMDEELATLRQELKAVQVELAWEKTQ